MKMLKIWYAISKTSVRESAPLFEKVPTFWPFQRRPFSASPNATAQQRAKKPSSTKIWRKGLPNKQIYFDCLNHELLLAKLNAYGFSKNAIKMVHSYLAGRRQRVKINGSFSSWKEMKLGVPQGSVLGPLLFSIYL